MPLGIWAWWINSKPTLHSTAPVVPGGNNEMPWWQTPRRWRWGTPLKKRSVTRTLYLMQNPGQPSSPRRTIISGGVYWLTENWIAALAWDARLCGVNVCSDQKTTLDRKSVV